ncbi:MAG: hypothetical protein ACKKMV_03095 [Candidatus Nealsonbacteria bacterium]
MSYYYDYGKSGIKLGKAIVLEKRERRIAERIAEENGVLLEEWNYNEGKWDEPEINYYVFCVYLGEIVWPKEKKEKEEVWREEVINKLEKSARELKQALKN